MLRKLNEVCKWCNEKCATLGLNQKKQCCQSFHLCCSKLIEMSESEPEYRGAFQRTDEAAIRAVGQACRDMYRVGVVQKPKMLVANKLENTQLASLEACLKMCSCLSFMCDNACEHIDNNLLDACMRLCSDCIKCGACVSEARSCISACTECAQSSNARETRQPATDSPAEISSVDLQNLIQRLVI